MGVGGGRAPLRVPRPQTAPRPPRRRSVAPLWALVLVAGCLFGLLLGRLAQVQLVTPEPAQEAAALATREVGEPAVRGRILAADGTLLAGNAPTTVVTVDPAVLLESDDEGRSLVEDAAAALGLPVEQVWGRTRVCGTADAPPVPRCFSGSPVQPIPLATDVDPARAIALLERPEDYPGIAVRTAAVRDHPDDGPTAAHLLGYLGAATAPEVEQGGALAEELLGRAGLEQTYDEALRGEPGRTTVAVDPRGVVTERLEDVDPVPGLDVVTHLDPQVQAGVERVLAETVASARQDDRPAPAAAAVVLDVRDGAVVASASWPTYDPDVWTGGISAQDFTRLTDPAGEEPLRDRTLAQTYPPASTFKVVTLPAALAGGGVDLHGEYPCPGSVSIAGRTFTNYESRPYGELDLPRILEVSCDTAFYQWAYADWVRLGGLQQDSDTLDPYVTTAQTFGLGRPTGVDLPGEASGLVPGREWRRATWEATREETCARAETGYPQEADPERRAFLEQLAQENCVDGWQYRPGDAVNFAIGQGDVAVTPLQMAVAYAAVANGGTVWEPRVAAELRTRDGVLVERVPAQEAGVVDLDPRALEVVRTGLEGVNVAGTGAAAFEGWPDGYPIAGKTGSAEAFGASATAWYASYGPVPDPRYVVVVVVEEGGTGGEVAAPAAREIWEVVRADLP